MSRFAKLASFRTRQRSLRRTEPEDERLADTAEKVADGRSTERSPDADRLKTQLDQRTESIKETAKDGSVDDLLATTADRRLIAEARDQSARMPAEDRVEIELAIGRTADVELRAGASKLGRTTDPDEVSKLDSMTRTAAQELTASTSAVRDTAPATELPPEVATAAAATETTAEMIAGNVSEFASMESSPLVAEFGGFDPSRSGQTESADDPPVQVDFDPERFDVGGGGGADTDHREVLEDFLEDADDRADELETASQLADGEASVSEAGVVTAGAGLDAHMSALEYMTIEGGRRGLDGVDVDYVLNDSSITAVMNGITTEGEAFAEHHVAVARAELAELRAEVARDFSDEMAEAYDESALADGDGVDVPPVPALNPYADQVDAFSARAHMATAELEGLAAMRDAYADYGRDLDGDISVLEIQLSAAEGRYALNQTMSFETVGAGGGAMDVFDYRLNQPVFDDAVSSLRDLSEIQAELAAKRAVLADVNAELELLDERVEDAEEDLERAEERLDEAEARLEEAIDAALSGDDLPDFDPDAVARADLEELRDDIADIEEQLEEIEQAADLSDSEADVAEGLASADAQLAETLAGLDFSRPQAEVEMILVPGGPFGTPIFLPASQIDSGVNDPLMRNAFDAMESSIESTAEAAQARAEADLAEQRQDDLEAMLDELRDAEDTLADEVPPLPESTEPVDSDAEPDDSSPQVTDIDPDADLDMTVVEASPVVEMDLVADVAEPLEPVGELADLGGASAPEQPDLEFGGGAVAEPAVMAEPTVMAEAAVMTEPDIVAEPPDPEDDEPAMTEAVFVEAEFDTVAEAPAAEVAPAVEPVHLEVDALERADPDDLDPG